MIFGLLAAAVSLEPGEFTLEPNELTELILWLIAAAVSLVPIVIFSISYIRVKSTKLLITTLAFSLFFIKTVVLAIKLFETDYIDEFWWEVAAVLDIVMICLIAYSLTRKE